jgi:hypothetical protein
MNHGLDFTSKGRGKGTQTPSPCPTPPSPLKPSDGKLTENSHSSWYIKRGHFKNISLERIHRRLLRCTDEITDCTFRRCC